MKFVDLKALAKSLGLELALGTSKDDLIDAILAGKGESKAKACVRPWKINGHQLKSDPDTRKFYKMLKWGSMPEFNVYHIMLNRGCSEETIAKLFGNGPPPTLEPARRQRGADGGASDEWNEGGNNFQTKILPNLSRSKTDDFNPRAHPSHPIDEKTLTGSEWAQLKVAKRSVNGSSGVIFALLTKGVVVLKSGGSLAEEIYGALIADKLKIPVPNMRLVRHSGGEYKEVQAALKKTVSVMTRVGLSRILQRRNLAVMEFINGRPLVELKVMPPHTVFKQLGGILVLDVILNNFDRLPFIWANRGNADNIHYSNGTMYALDNRIVCPTSMNARANHIEKVEAVCKGIVEQGTKAEEWARIDEFWRTKTLMGALGDNEIKEMQAGFLETAQRAAKELTLKSLKEMVTELKAMDEERSQFWSKQVQGVDVDFILSIVESLKVHLVDPKSSKS